MWVKLGNDCCIERGEGLDSEEVHEVEGNVVTYVSFPEDMKLIEAFTAVTSPTGVWAAHSTGTPTWVASDNDRLAELLAENYGCPIGIPDDVEDTHYTEHGPPGVGPSEEGE